MFYWEERQDKIEDILRFSQTIERNKGFLQGYEDVEDLIQYVDESCTMGCYDDTDGLIHGFILLEWLDEREASLHVCAFTNEFDWVRAWNEQIESHVSEIVDRLHAVIPRKRITIVKLTKRIGFQFNKVGNYYKGLKEL